MPSEPSASDASELKAVAITGATGLIGSALADSLRADGCRVVRIVRSRPEPGDVSWDPAAGTIDAAGLEGVDAVVNLAGENIGQRWTDDVRHRLRVSRVDGTGMLARAIASLADRPRVLLNASAIGIYGDRGDAVLDEQAPAADDFLGQLAQEWEGATRPAAEAGIRVALARFGVVLSSKGGALSRLLLPFRMGVGGKLGSGEQWFSWISLDDVVAALRFILRTPALSGPINVAAPEPVTNAEFTDALGRALHRPTVLTVPQFALEAVYGEMADATLFVSHRAVPARLLDQGFRFRHPRIDDALRAALASG